MIKWLFHLLQKNSTREMYGQSILCTCVFEKSVEPSFGDSLTQFMPFITDISQNYISSPNICYYPSRGYQTIFYVIYFIICIRCFPRNVINILQ